ncbi:hypothetical protein C8R44DRAFT_743034 [Mycena epipterygia]|nr:hypothetical protein C8R44DRAFT_743034 [Mycena epipterygia]
MPLPTSTNPDSPALFFFRFFHVHDLRSLYPLALAIVLGYAAIADAHLSIQIPAQVLDVVGPRILYAHRQLFTRSRATFTLWLSPTYVLSVFPDDLDYSVLESEFLCFDPEVKRSGSAEINDQLRVPLCYSA